MSTCARKMSAWNKLIVKQKFCASSWLITEIKNTFNIFFRFIFSFILHLLPSLFLFSLSLLSSSPFILSDIILYYESLCNDLSLLASFFLPFYHFRWFIFPVLPYSAYFTHVLWAVILHLLLFMQMFSPLESPSEPFSLFLYSVIT